MISSLNAKKRNRRRVQAGKTLLELVVVLAVIGIVSGAGMSLFMSVSKFRNEASTRNVMLEQANEITRSFQEDTAYAGAGTGNGEHQPKLLFKTDDAAGTANGSVPSVFISQDGTSASMLLTTPDGVGTVLSTAGGQALINAVDPEAWTKLKADSLLLFSNPGGSVSLLQLTRAPRIALESDFPPNVPAAPEYSLVADFRTFDSCNFIKPISSTVDPGAIVTPIVSLVRYRLETGAGFIREELDTCSTEARVEKKVVLAPIFCEQASFAYKTKDGESLTLPADLTALQGLVCKIRLRDEKTRVTREVNLDVAPFGWR